MLGEHFSLFYTGDAVPSLRKTAHRRPEGQTLLVTTLTPAGADLPPGADAEVYDADWTDDAYTATTHSLLANEIGRIRHVSRGQTAGCISLRRTATGGLATASRGSTTTSSSASPRPSERRARPAETRSVNHG